MDKFELQERLETAIDAIWSEGTSDEQADILHVALTTIPSESVRAAMLDALEATLENMR